MTKFKSITALLLAGCMLTACGSDTTSTTGTTTGTAGTTGVATTTDGVHLYVAQTEELVSPDPNKAESAVSILIAGYVNMGLYKYDVDGSIVLDAAKSVEISEDGCTYTFTMRDDIVWTNGTAVTAYDYEYSFKRLANPDVGCVYAWMLPTIGIENGYEVAYGGADVDTLGIEAVDESTLIIKFNAPKSYISELLASQPCFKAVNQEFCESTGDLFMSDLENSIFCGPLYMTEWEVGGTAYQLSKNPTYYDADKITCDTVNYTFLPDAQQRILAWQNGTINSTVLTGEFVPMYTEDESLRTSKQAGMFFITFNTENEYLSNQNLRLAISTAINKDNIADSILQDGSNGADYIIPEEFAADSKGVTYRENADYPTYNEYNPDLALEYFEKAKAELGTDSISLSFLYNEDTSLSAIAAYVQFELQQALPGLTITLSPTTYNQRLSNMSSGDYDLGITRWYADYQDAGTFLDMWIEDSALNYGNWYNAEYNELYNKVINEYALDEEARIAAQIRMEQIFLEDAAVCPLYQAAVCELRLSTFNWVYTPTNVTLLQYTTRK